MDTIKTVGTMLLIIVGLASIVISWYITVGIVLLYITYNVAKGYVKVKKVLNE